MQTLYITHPACLLHAMQKGHPECARRLEVIQDQLMASGVYQHLDCREAPAACLNDLARCHDMPYLKSLQIDIPHAALHCIDDETALNAHSWDAVRHAAGAGILAVNEILGGRAKTALCAVRPPGHHAEPDRAMGFCFINNLAVAAFYAREHYGLQRIAVIDFDVHHGNGTEKMLAGLSWVEMYGFFQRGCYPFTGMRSPAANMHNTAIDAYTPTKTIREIVSGQWVPQLDAFKPQLMLISAGFDAHAEDDMSQLALYESDYRWLTEQLLAVADRWAAGRVISFLEGGYELSSLARSAVEHIRVLAGLNSSS